MTKTRIGSSKEAEVLAVMAFITLASLLGVVANTSNHSGATTDSPQVLRTVVINATTLAAPSVQIENTSLSAGTRSVIAVVFRVESSVVADFSLAIATGGSEVSPQDMSSGLVQLPAGVQYVFESGNVVSNVSAFQTKAIVTLTGVPLGNLSLELVVFEQGQSGGPVGEILPFSIQVTG